MRNLKKALAFVVVFAMMLSTVAFAAPADVEGTDYEDAVTRLAALNILKGFPDGTFRPDEKVTRAQMAVIMCNAVGVGDAAKYAQGETKFSDVAADHWAAGYIKVASDMGIIKGNPDGTFAPEAEVTYAQAITMLVRALGYEPKAQAMGGYPGGYLAVAAEKEITKDVSVVSTLGATRGDIALMTDASLDVDMMEQTTWGQYPEYEEKPGKTLLSEKLNVDEIVGRVVEIPNLGKSTLDDNEIVVNVTEVNGDKVTADEKTYTLIDSTTPDSLFGLEVKAWINDDDEVVFVNVETDEDDIYTDTIKTNVASNDEEVELKVLDDKYDVNVDDVTVYINYQKAAFTDLKAGMHGTFVEDKNEIVFINVFDWENTYKDTKSVSGGPMVVTEVNGDEIEYFNTTDDTSTLDLEDYDAVFVTGDAKDVSDIDKYDVLYWWVNDDDEIFITVVSNKVEGVIGAVNDSKVEIDDEDYDVVADTTISDDDDDTIVLYTETVAKNLAADDAEVIAALDINGDLRHVAGKSEATSGKVYGIMTDADNSSVTIFNEKGEEVTYSVDQRSDAFPFEEYFSSTTVSSGNADSIYNYKQYIPVEYEINSDGEIAKNTLKAVVDAEGELADYTITFAADSHNVIASSGNVVDFNKNDYIQVGTSYYYIEKDTVIMKYNSVKDDDPKLVSWDDIKDTKSTSAKFAVVGKDGDVADFVVFYANYDDVAADDTYYGVITSDARYDGDNYLVDIDVFTNDDIDDGKFALDVDGNKSVAKEATLIQFKVNTDNEIKDLTVTGSVYKAYNSTPMYVAKKDGRTLELASTSTATSGTAYRIETDAVVYTIEDDGDIDTRKSYSDINVGDALVFITDKDNAKLIKAALIVNEYVNAGSGSTGGGSVTGAKVKFNYSDTAPNLILDEDGTNKSYQVDANVVIELPDGSLGSISDLTANDIIDYQLGQTTNEVIYIKIKQNN